MKKKEEDEKEINEGFFDLINDITGGEAEKEYEKKEKELADLKK